MKTSIHRRAIVIVVRVSHSFDRPRTDSGEPYPSSTSQPAVATPKAWPEVRSLAGSDLVEILAAGVNDLRAGGRYSLFFGAFYGVGGLILLVLVRFNVPYLIYPLAMGFVLIAPFMATGLYDI